jgi:hypothetical protein
MSESETRPFRSIIKDGQTYSADRREYDVEIAAWTIKRAPVNISADPKGSVITKVGGELRYNTILEVVLGRRELQGYSPRTPQELAERTESKTYRDEQGGRSASTIRGYLSNDTLEGLPSSHPVKRVLRREIRTYNIGHFATEDMQTTSGDLPRPINMNSLEATYRLARKIASDNGLVFLDASPVSEAIEDNKLIDEAEIRPVDRPTGDFKASVMVIKESRSGEELSTYEYKVDLDKRTLESIDDYGPPV